MATGPVKTKAKPTTYKQVPSGKFDPFGGTNTFQQQELPTYTPATSASSGAGPGAAAGAAQGFGGQGGVPQAFADDIANDLNRTVVNGTVKGNDGEVTPKARPGTVLLNYQDKYYVVPLNPDGSVSQEGFNQVIQQAWANTPNDKKASYQSRDSGNIANQNTSQLQGIATTAALGGPAQDAAVANKLWQPVTAAQQGATTAMGAQQTTNRATEATDAAGTQRWGTTLDQEEALRRAGIDLTNAGNIADSQRFATETDAANARNTGFADQLTASAAHYNGLQSQGLADYTGQLQGINANQSAALGTFMGDIGSANAQQNANLSQFGGAVSSANGQSGQILNQFGGAVSSANNNQNQIVAQLSQQLSQLNEQDKASYLQYLNETNPMMAQMVAQASNPEYVANQTNAIQQFKNNYNPEVTDQERFLAELARRKFEGDDQSSREAVMQQLAGRGLKSGGLVIAGQQQAQQQMSQDRMLNELGLNANAVQRAERNRVDYSNASDSLRNADDAMRHFQDSYAQNDAIRRSNLALDRNQQSLATTRQVGDRNEFDYNAKTQSNSLNYERNRDYYDASRQTNNDIYGRNLDYYNAGTETVNNNFSRTQAGFDATTKTNFDNGNRDTDIFNGLTKSNEDNAGRESAAIGNQAFTNQVNLGNTQNAITGPAGTTTARTNANTLSQGGTDKREIVAGAKREGERQDTATQRGDRQTETTNAQNWVPIATGSAQTGINIQKGITAEQQAAIDKLLGRGELDEAEAAKRNV